MKKIKFTNLAVFILFFGVAMVEALRNHNWIEAGLFISIGLMSLRVDLK